MSVLALDEIRKKVIYQNTVDIWIAVCQEHGTDWKDTEKYKKFIADLLKSDLKMKKFPLCIKESGGNFERGKIRQSLVKNFPNQMMKIAQSIQ